MPTLLSLPSFSYDTARAPQSASSPGPDGSGVSSTTMSPESLLAYCQMQLGDLDSQISDQMNTQQTALREREAVQSAQDVLEQYGTDGPQTPADMQKCVDALNSAIAQLPANDPVAGQLGTFRDQMTAQYDYTPGRALTDAEAKELAADQQVVSAAQPVMASVPGGGAVTTTPEVNLGSLDTANAEITNFQAIEAGSFTPRIQRAKSGRERRTHWATSRTTSRAARRSRCSPFRISSPSGSRQ